MTKQDLSRIGIGQQVFSRGSTEEFGAVRGIDPARQEIIIYVENVGEFAVSFSAISAVAEEKVMLDAGQLSPKLRQAIRAAHDAEDPAL